VSRKIIASLFLIAIGFCPVVFAAATVGEVSSVMTSITAGFINMLEKVCFVIGAGLFIGAMIRYKEHRDNPQQIRIGDSIALLIAAVAIGCLPLIARFSDAYSAMVGL